MADNKDSYTYKNYNRNKRIFHIIRTILVFYALWLLYYFITSMPSILKSPSPFIGMVIVSIIFLLSLKFVSKLDLQNRRDIKKNYNTWGKGAGAELYIDRSLEKLPEGYKVINDFANGHGNIDSIIICPKWIFTIEVKAHKGTISYINGRIRYSWKEPRKRLRCPNHSRKIGYLVTYHNNLIIHFL